MVGGCFKVIEETDEMAVLAEGAGKAEARRIAARKDAGDAKGNLLAFGQSA